MVMCSPLDEIATPAWAIRAEQPIDIDQIHELHRATFASAAEAELVDGIRSGPDFLPELSLVAATDDGSVLGHVLVSRVVIEHEDASRPRTDVLALAPIAVLPPHQGRGIGTALMRTVLEAADAREEPMTIVVGSPAFYARFGFVPAAELGISGPYDRVGDAFQARLRPGLAEGELPVGIVVYPAMFSTV
jgi:putative acetyltransferase